MSLPKIITDPPCKGCQKRKEWLKGAAHRSKKFMARTVLKGSNAARRIIRAPVRRNSPVRWDRSAGTWEAAGRLTHGGTTE